MRKWEKKRGTCSGWEVRKLPDSPKLGEVEWDMQKRKKGKRNVDKEKQDNSNYKS